MSYLCCYQISMFMSDMVELEVFQFQVATIHHSYPERNTVFYDFISVLKQFYPEKLSESLTGIEPVTF